MNLRTAGPATIAIDIERSSGHGFSRAIEEGRRAALAAEGMAIPSRRQCVAGTYFVTSRAWQSRALFVTDSFSAVFLESLLHYRQEAAYSLHAFVPMPDHFRILLTPAPGKSLERVIQYIKGGSTRRLALERNMSFPVWLRGFSDHGIRYAVDFAAQVRYIWENPVRKKLVTVANEFRWSTDSGAASVLDEPPQGLKPPAERRRRHFAARLKPCPDDFYA
jgi:REP element-mobilizing transposase RayT